MKTQMTNDMPRSVMFVRTETCAGSRICLAWLGMICIGLAGASPAGANNILYVRADAVDAGNGTSWAHAYHDLQDALAVAAPGNEIWVAGGTYLPGEPGVRTATFVLKTGVGIYGGFSGTEVSRNERDPATNLTVLSGDLRGNDLEVVEPMDLVSESTRSDNSYHVITGSGGNETAILDGFVITGGNARDSEHSNGGGMINVWKAASPGRTGDIESTPANPTLVNCTFHRNSAAVNGGGIYNERGMPTLIDCVFSENHAQGAAFEEGGGGMYNERGNLTLRACRFIENTAESNGAGLYNRNASPDILDSVFNGNVVVVNSGTHTGGGILNNFSDAMIINCTFTGNSAPHGGGIWNRGAPGPTISNCVFSRNEAVYTNDGTGGGIQNWGAGTNASVINCTFSENTAVALGAGLGANVGSTAVVSNCIFWGNRAGNRTDASAQIGSASGNPTVVTHSCVQGGKSGEGNMDTDPHFADPQNGDFRLKSQAGRWNPLSGSWAQDGITSPCIDGGDPMSPIGQEPFPNGGVINMGAYGGTARAGKSYFGQTPCDSIIAGDLNGDCKVDHTDLAIMALHWTDVEPMQP